MTYIIRLAVTSSGGSFCSLIGRAYVYTNSETDVSKLLLVKLAIAEGKGNWEHVKHCIMPGYANLRVLTPRLRQG